MVKTLAKFTALILAVLLVLSVVAVLLFRWLPLPMSAVIFERSLTERQWQHYDWTPLKQMSPYAALAVIASEDQRFPQHHGIDLKEIRAALAASAAGGELRGASTITQQVARNVFLWQGRSYLRKALELYFSLLIEALWPKARIVEVYLNIAETGPRTFGFAAGAQRFLRKPVNQLTELDAALMAAALPNPRAYRINAPDDYLRERQQWIRAQMRQLGGLEYLRTIGIKATQ